MVGNSITPKITCIVLLGKRSHFQQKLQKDNCLLLSSISKEESATIATVFDFQCFLDLDVLGMSLT